ncbi:MAG: hypothetical protein GYA87_03885 [Christensenellaceae bacterium]|nr:hypothetical protein [Christensenellaceae bacterium]
MLSKIRSQLNAELKHNSLPSILASVIIIGIAYFIFGVNNLDAYSKAMVIERFLPLPGIFSIVTLFDGEHRSPIKDILLMRNTRIEFIYVLRFLLRLFIYGIISFAYIYILMQAELSIELVKMLFHSLSIGLFVGAIGLLVFSSTNNIAPAFLSSIGLILAQWFFPKNTGKTFMLFTMPEISVSKMLLVFGFSLVMILFSIFIWKRKSNF